MVGLARWRRNWAAPLVIAGIGLAQMMLEVIILFAFQLLHGYIYAEISLIVTTFMAGLALGGAASNRLIDNPGQRRRDTETQKKKVKPRKILITVQTTIILYSGLLPFILLLPIPAPTLVFPLLALLAGFLTGMAFPVALALGQGNVSQRAGMLYGADLVGGCLGALLGAVFFIPLLGIPQTCAAVALVGLAGLLALI
jgi:spermidine synthase